MKFALVILFLFTTTAAAQKAATRARPVSASNYSQLGMGVLTWQQGAVATKAAGESNIELQFVGVRLGYAYGTPKGVRWRPAYEFNLLAGTVKGKGETAAVQDNLKGQLWYGISFVPELMYRTSRVSEVGLALPVMYRQIQWKLKEGSTLKVKGSNDASVGVAFISKLRFSKDSAMNLSLGHQYVWKSTIWALGWEFMF